VRGFARQSTSRSGGALRGGASPAVLAFDGDMRFGSCGLRRRAFVPLLACAALAGIACGEAPSASEPPNLLLVVLDTFRADRLGVAGYPLPTTPNLDALARRGVVFRNAYAPATWTKPSMASLFTSVYPTEHGIQDYPAGGAGPLVARGLHESFETVAESLRDAGYTTAAIANQVHLKRQLGFAQGFEHWRESRGKDARWVNRQGQAMLDGELLPRQAPYFLWLHYMDTHFPYNSTSRSMRGRFGRRALAAPPPRSRPAFLAWEAAGVSREDAAALAARYDEEVAELDAWLGNLFAGLERRGLLASTVVVVTADHGEGFGEHGRFQHGFEPYEEVAKVPLVVVAPEPYGFPPGFRDTPVSLVDLAPTFVELAGRPPVPAHRGRSLVGLLRGVEAPERTAFVQSETVHALRRGHLKLWLADGRTLRLFDLAADPGERRDLATTDCEGACRELAVLLQSRLRSLTLPPHVDATALDAEDRAALEALGYL
jgi:choline-sulfatase